MTADRGSRCMDNQRGQPSSSPRLWLPLAPTPSNTSENLFDYIEVFYNRQRLHSTLNYTTPAAYEQMHQAA